MHAERAYLVGRRLRSIASLSRGCGGLQAWPYSNELLASGYHYRLHREFSLHCCARSSNRAAAADRTCGPETHTTAASAAAGPRPASACAQRTSGALEISPGARAWQATVATEVAQSGGSRPSNAHSRPTAEAVEGGRQADAAGGAPVTWFAGLVSSASGWPASSLQAAVNDRSL